MMSDESVSHISVVQVFFHRNCFFPWDSSRVCVHECVYP